MGEFITGRQLMLLILPPRVTVFNNRIEIAFRAVKILDMYPAIYHDKQRYT